MLGWVTINLERDILGKLVRLSQHPVRRHAIKVLNIFMVQLLSSTTSEDEPSSDPHHAGARLLLAQAIKGFTNCRALMLTGHPSAQLQRQSRFLPALMPQYLSACTTYEHFKVVMKTSMLAFHLDGRRTSQLFLQEEGLLGHQGNGELVFDSLIPKMVLLPFLFLTSLSYTMSSFPIRRAYNSAHGDDTQLPERRFRQFVERLPALNHLSRSIFEDFGQRENDGLPADRSWSMTDPWSKDFWAFTKIPYLSKLELRSGYPNPDKHAGFICRHKATVRSIAFTNVAMFGRYYWQKFAASIPRLKLTQAAIDRPLALGLNFQCRPFDIGENTGVQKVVMEGDVLAALRKFQRDSKHEGDH